MLPSRRTTTQDWTGHRGCHVRHDADNYFAIGLMGPDATRRASASVIRHYVVFADDVGTKVEKDRWETYFALGFPAPTAIIETSPSELHLCLADRHAH